jgi:hypothetical protein
LRSEDIRLIIRKRPIFGLRTEKCVEVSLAQIDLRGNPFFGSPSRCWQP